MSDEPVLSLESLLREQSRLRARLAKVEAAIALLEEDAGEGARAPNAWVPAPTPTTSRSFSTSLVSAVAAPLIKVRAFDSGSLDPTFRSLINAYRSHPESPYHKLKHNVRRNYDQALNRLLNEIGLEVIATWDANRIQQIYDLSWAAGGRVSMGHTMIAKLRLLTSFGSTVLNDDASTRLSAILGNMRFPVAKGRAELLTIDHVRAIRATAHNHFNWSSIALAQALLFEIPKLRQVDVIGEWVPLGEPGTSDVTNGAEKWLYGLRWSDIDENMMLHRVLTSGRKNQQKEVEFKLPRFAMVMEEINRTPPWNRTGPMIVCEYTQRPWSGSEFRRKWRIVADKAGVPSEIKSTSPISNDSGNDGSKLRAADDLF